LALRLSVLPFDFVSLLFFCGFGASKLNSSQFWPKAAKNVRKTAAWSTEFCAPRRLELRVLNAGGFNKHLTDWLGVCVCLASSCLIF